MWTRRPTIWNVVNRIKAKNNSSGRMLSTSRSSATWEEVANGLLDHFVKRDPLEEDTTEQTAIREQCGHGPNNPPAPSVTTEEVRECLAGLKNQITPGLDLIENEALKGAGEFLAPGLAELFNGCLRQGVFPASWKVARLITILKKKELDQEDPSSYRPICLLTGLSKLLEKVLKTRILSTCEFHPKQYGFRRGNNTTDAVKDLLTTCKTTKERHAVVIFIDIEAAFDSLWWPHILKELKTQGCHGNVYRLIADYLRAREVLLVDGARWARREQERGCPQGSVLGPVLWNIAFNGLITTLAEKRDRKSVV